MKCSKCGFEYESGRSCPQCGANSILIHEDYYRRKKEWEEEKARKEEEEKSSKKFQISQETKKKILRLSAAAVLAAVIIYGASKAALEYVRTHAYEVGFASDTQRIYSCDGAFSYDRQEVFSVLTGEQEQIFCSADGISMAAVIYEEEKEKYCLYVSQGGESRLAYETADELSVLRVNTDGSVVLREMERGEYGILLQSRIIEAGDAVQTLTESDMTMIETGKDGRYCFYWHGQVLIWENGKTESLYIDEDADEVIYAGNEVYYRKNDCLYDYLHNEMDSGVLSVYHVFGTDELLYFKEASAVLVESNGHRVEFDRADEVNIPWNINVSVRQGSKIYVNFDGKTEVLNIRKKRTEQQITDTKAYLYVK